MQSDYQLTINIAQLKNEPLLIETELKDDFFAALEQDEIKGGDIKLSLQVRPAAGDIYVVKAHLEGTAVVQCDRCLDDLSLPVEVSDTLKLKFGAPAEDDAEDMLYAEPGQVTYDFAWLAYELAETALPLVRTHEPGDCNPDMLRYISATVPEADDDEA